MKLIKKKNNIAQKLLYLFIAIIVCVVMIKITTCITDIFLKGSFKFTWLFLNHTLQLILSIIIMIIPMWHKSISDRGINLKNKKLTFAIIKKFSLGWIICTTAYFVVSNWIAGWPDLLSFTVNFKNTAIYLLFESTIVGLSEEIFFRGIIYNILSKEFNKKINLPGFSVSQAGIITAIIFAGAHIGIQVYPFVITYFDISQVISAFILGIFYAVILEKTNSLLGSILAHNISDAWLSILYLILTKIN